MRYVWKREKKPKSHWKVCDWYLQDDHTDLTHMRVVWVNTQHPRRQMSDGWYVVVMNAPEVGREYLLPGYDRIDQAKRAAVKWWSENETKYLKQFGAQNG